MNGLGGTLAHALEFDGHNLAEALALAAAWAAENDDEVMTVIAASVNYVFDMPEVSERVMLTLVVQGCELDGCCRNGEDG